DERIPRVDSAAWAADQRTLLYVTEDPVTKRHDKLFRHAIGTDTSDLVYTEPDDLFDLDVHRTRDGVFILLQIESKTSTETRCLPSTDPSSPLKIIIPREPDHEYDVEHRAGEFVIRTNKAAKNFRVVFAPVVDPSERNWRDLVRHRPDVKVE